MGGPREAAETLRLARGTIYTWKHRGASLHGAERLRTWALHLGGLDDVVAHLDVHIAEKRRRRDALDYIARTIGYAAGGWWPSFIHTKEKMPRVPDAPPRAMTDEELAIARRWLGERGWTLIRDTEGHWRPCQTL